MPIRPAATVVLLRDGADGLEVWLQQRATTLAFAAGMYAFPGGRVDDDEDVYGSGARRLGRSARSGATPTTRWCASTLAGAVRETWEESGVRLDPAHLVPWGRWVTPPGDTRRFDARFYLARCPADQDACAPDRRGGGGAVVRRARRPSTPSRPAHFRCGRLRSAR